MARQLRLSDGWILDWTLTDRPGDKDVFTRLDGWYGSDTRLDTNAMWQDGTHVGQLWREGRKLTLAGRHRIDCEIDHVEDEQNRLRRAIAGAFRSGQYGDGYIRVTEETTGVTLEARQVQLDGAPRFKTGGEDGPRSVSWELPLIAGDPLLYEWRPVPYILTAYTAGLDSGLEYPLFDDAAGVTTGFLEFSGERDSTQGALTNWGTAVTYPQVMISGVFPSGFRVLITSTQQRRPWEVTYRGEITAQSEVVVDFSGSVMVNGVDQSWAVTDPSWGGVEPGEAVTVRIEGVSGGVGMATLLVEPAYL